MKTLLFLPLVTLFVLASPVRAQTADDSAAVERAARDYLDGFYEGDTAKIVRAIHPDVNKFGFSIPRGQRAYRGYPMTYAGFLESAREVRAGDERVPANAPRGVRLLDIMDQIAAVRVTAIWGVDYLLLAKYDGRWMVRQVLWQSRQ